MASSGNPWPPVLKKSSFENTGDISSTSIQSGTRLFPSSGPMNSSNSTQTSLKPPAPTPILKSSKLTINTARKRTCPPNAFSVEFSQEVIISKKESTSESDTDVDSNASYNFDDDDSSVANCHDKTPEITNSSYNMSRVGAKVRRLDLGDVKGGARGDMDTCESCSGFGSPPNSPRDCSVGKRSCPPSTMSKKGAVSRVLLSKGIMKEEDDSPRDAADFPFFADSSDDMCERLAVGRKSERNDEGKINSDANTSVFGRSDSVAGFDSNALTATSSPKCPPTAMKKNRHRRDLSPPRNLKYHGRADSFVQMFSREPLLNDDLMDTAPSSPKCPPTAIKKASRRGDLSPPKSLRAHGRADSFLQMFSQEPLLNSDDANMSEDERYSLKSPNEVHFQKSFPVSQPQPPSTSSFSRFVADFEIVGTLGNGSFGCVYKVRNRMDKRMYAIKAAKREARGASDRGRMLQEVYALAALSDDTTAAAMHIVGYHQAWMEGNRLYIQTELCDGSLEKEIAEGGMDEKRRYKVLREMLLALDLVHKSGMIHLDIKPENIFIKNNQYKLGDFGLVSKIENHDDVEEGDSRYMSMELLSGDLDDLTKSDIFSLGATMYEICLGRPLPENGQEWQDIRQGILEPMRNTAFELQMIVRSMLAPEKESRPSAADLLKKRQLLSDEQQQLIVERNKANAANMALNQMIRASPRKRFHRSNTVS